MAEIDGVAYVVDPDKSATPPDEAAYQSIVFPAVVDAEIFTEPGPQMLPLVPVGAATETMFTAALDVVEHPADEVTVTV